MSIKNKVQLITYPDSLGGDLKALHHTIETYFPDSFQGGLHILPPFPSSGDRGFAPLTYASIAPEFGSWEDIHQLSKKHDILLDLMVNHISAKSDFFQDYLSSGPESQYADLFLPIEKIWPDGKIPPDDFQKIFLRRTEPYSDFMINGEIRRIWTTFGKVTPSEQIDLDVNSTTTRQFLSGFLENFARNQTKIVRLDAIGYVIKKPGTSFFFVEPEIFEFLDWITAYARDLDMELLPEVHAHHTIQKKLADQGHWIYDFILPYRILEALLLQDSRALCAYLKDRPTRQFTMLDCHDGVPIKPDLDDLYEGDLAKEVVKICLDRGSNLSLIYAPEYQDPDGFDVHQIRGTYYSMLGENDDAYLAARAIQFFTPGIPQVYYVGLLAGKNNLKVLETGGDGRDINRHNYSLEEIATDVQKEPVKRLLKLIDFRNNFPAFQGKFSVGETQNNRISLRWDSQIAYCILDLDFETMKSTIRFCTEGGEEQVYEP